MEYYARTDGQPHPNLFDVISAVGGPTWDKEIGGEVLTARPTGGQGGSETMRARGNPVSGQAGRLTEAAVLTQVRAVQFERALGSHGPARGTP